MCSETTFYLLLDEDFPQLKFRTVQAFAKCATCVELQLQKEKAVTSEERQESFVKLEEHNRVQLTFPFSLLRRYLLFLLLDLILVKRENTTPLKLKKQSQAQNYAHLSLWMEWIK